MRIHLPQVDLTSFRASEANLWGRKAAERETKSREVVSHHIKSEEGLFWKSKMKTALIQYCRSHKIFWSRRSTDLLATNKSRYFAINDSNNC